MSPDDYICKQLGITTKKGAKRLDALLKEARKMSAEDERARLAEGFPPVSMSPGQQHDLHERMLRKNDQDGLQLYAENQGLRALLIVERLKAKRVRTAVLKVHEVTFPSREPSRNHTHPVRGDERVKTCPVCVEEQAWLDLNSAVALRPKKRGQSPY